MKNVIFVFLMSPLLLGSLKLSAQNWLTAGNALNADGTLGTTTNFSVLFRTNNTERGRITNTGLWGFGTTKPNARVHINGPSNKVPLRVDVTGSTKLLVHNDGGVTIGTDTTPPANGLYVAGNTGIGTSVPDNTLHVFKGSAGATTGYGDAPLIVENSTHSYVNILAPDASETGILFGKPANNVSGGIIYNSAATPNGLQFRTNGNIANMILTEKGSLGLRVLPGEYDFRIKQNDISIFSFDLLNSSTGNDWNFWVNDQSPANLQLWCNSIFRGQFDGASGAYKSISDERLKTNIKPMGAMLEKIRQLKPSTYQFKDATNNQEYNGFIAQDVSKLFPSIVSHNVDPKHKIDVYTMDYSQFGVLAIKGIQELQPIIEEQNEEIATLKKEIAELKAIIKSNPWDASVNDKRQTPNTKQSNSRLEQNKPNPFNKTTTINYTFPQQYSSAKIIITDKSGKTLKTANISGAGKGSLNIDASSLSPGIYQYSLIVDERLIESKQMLLTK